jgi:hypothetical protein
LHFFEGFERQRCLTPCKPLNPGCKKSHTMKSILTLAIMSAFALTGFAAEPAKCCAKDCKCTTSCCKAAKDGKKCCGEKCACACCKK